MNPEAFSALGKLFGDRLRTSLETRICYSFDATGRKFLPDAVVYPVNAEEVRQTVLLANLHRFPVVPRGAGSGFSGGSLPVRGGVVLSTERMDRIVSIDTENLYAVVEPGVVTGTLKEEARKTRALLPAGPRVAEVQHPRREYRRVRGRNVRGEVRRHARLRPRSRGGAGDRGTRPDRRRDGERGGRVRPHPDARGLRGDARGSSRGRHSGSYRCPEAAATLLASVPTGTAGAVGPSTPSSRRG